MQLEEMREKGREPGLYQWMVHQGNEVMWFFVDINNRIVGKIHQPKWGGEYRILAGPGAGIEYMTLEAAKKRVEDGIARLEAKGWTFTD